MFTVIMKILSVITLLVTMIIGTGNERSIESRTEIPDIRSDIRISPIDGKNIPLEMSYQGYLIQISDSTPVTGELDIEFDLFVDEVGGIAFWTETYIDVSVINGIFNVILGSTNPLDPDDFTGDPLWLQITVDGEVMSPRKKIVSTAYTVRALYSDTADYVLSGIPDNAWTIIGNVLYPTAHYGIAMYSNTLYGNQSYTHVNLGVACTTGTSGQNYFYCTVSGGYNNTSSGYYATVGGGRENTSSFYYSTVGGGAYNTSSGHSSTVGGGRENTSSEINSTVGGGYNNTSSGGSSTVGGGYQNTSSDSCATVSGGYNNTSSERYSTIGGGLGNTSSGWYSTIGGGGNNISYGSRSTVGGGCNNTSSGDYSTIGGGKYNTSSVTSSTVGGGSNNTSSGGGATVGGGYYNTSSYYYSTIGGGYQNTSSGNSSTIPGGQYVNVSGDFSFGFGRGTASNMINVTDNYDIVFGDGGYDYQFGINRENPSYPLHIGTDGTNGNGARLTGSGVWTNGCSRTFKENFVKPDPDKILELVKKLDVFRYNYKGDQGVYHISPVAEDFYDLFETGSDNRYLAGLDVSGVALLAIKALAKENEEIAIEIIQLNTRIDYLTHDNQELRSEIEQMRADIEMLKRLNN